MIPALLAAQDGSIYTHWEERIQLGKAPSDPPKSPPKIGAPVIGGAITTWLTHQNPWLPIFFLSFFGKVASASPCDALVCGRVLKAAGHSQSATNFNAKGKCLYVRIGNAAAVSSRHPEFLHLLRGWETRSRSLTPTPTPIPFMALRSNSTSRIGREW